MDYELMLRRCRIGEDTPLRDVGIRGGRIEALAAELPGGAAEVVDCGGRVVLPGFVDAHTHLDKTFGLEAAGNESGTLAEAIRNWRAHRPSIGREDFLERASRAVRLAVAAGTTAIRTHVDVGPGVGLNAAEAMLEVRERFQERIPIQVVALGQRPEMYGGGRGYLREAAELGVQGLGLATDLDTDPRAAIELTLDIAAKHGLFADFHVDETDGSETLTLETLAEVVAERGLQGGVTAGHCCSLGSAPPAVAERVMEKVAAAGLNVITLPSCNLYLQGRQDTGPVRRGLTRVRELLAHGVNVAAASDNVRDPFNPLGRYDLLQIANLTAHAAHMGSPAEQEALLRMVTAAPARILGLADHAPPSWHAYGLTPGSRADLVVLDCQRPSDVIAEEPPRLLVVAAGRIVARTRVEREVDL